MLQPGQKPIGIPHIITLCLLASGGIFFLVSFPLLNNPSYPPIATAVSFLVLTLISLWIASRGGKKLVITSIFLLGAMICGTLLWQPPSKEKIEAMTYTAGLTQAAEKGWEVVKENDCNNTDCFEELAAIAEEKTQHEKELAQSALNYALSHPQASRTEVINTLVTTVPVRHLNWTCNQNGCSFASLSNIWTLSSATLLVGGGLLSSSLCLLWWLLIGKVYSGVLSRNKGN